MNAEVIKRQKLYQFRATVEVQCLIQVNATGEADATDRLRRGAWQSVDPQHWDKSRLISFAETATEVFK